MKSILLLACILACGCDNISKDINNQKKQGSVLSKTDINWAEDIKTVFHDGHKWVIVSHVTVNTGTVSMLHHPDCGCEK